MKLYTYWKSCTLLMAVWLITAGAFESSGADWFARYNHTSSNLLCRYSFDGDMKSAVRDIVSNRSATVQNVTLTEGYSPLDLKFDGKHNFQFADTLDANKRQDFTVSCYVKLTGGSGYFVLKKSSFGLAVDEEKNVIAYIYTKAGETVTFAAGKADENFHLWTLVVKDLTATVYCDGKVVGKRGLQSPAAYSAELINLGHSDGWKPVPVLGEMRNFRIYSEALAPETIAACAAEFANGKLPPVGSTLEMELPMGAENSFVGDDIGYEKKPAAFFFNGKDSMLQLSDYSELKTLTGLTVGCWIKPENITPRNMDEQGAIISANSGASAGWTLTTYYQGGLSCTLVTDQGKFSAEAFNVLQKGVWQHVAFVWDGKTLQLLVNGRPVGQSVKAEGNFLYYTDRPVVGRLADREGCFFYGAVDDVKIYSMGLSPESDPETGKLQITVANNEDVDPLPEKLVHFPGMENAVSPVPVLVDFEDLTGWRVETYKNVAEAVFCRSQDDRLWGDYTGKLIIQSGTHFDPDRKKADLYPPQELAIDGEVDHVSIYVSAQNWTYASGMKISVTIRDSENKLHTIPLQSREQPFVYWSGWGVFVKKLPSDIKFPARLVKLSFYEFNGNKPEIYYLDNLSFFKMPPPVEENITVPEWDDINLGMLPGSTVPAVDGASPEVNLSCRNNIYTFSVKTNDNSDIQYIYQPCSGTFSDIKVIFNGNTAFYPMANGGLTWVDDDGTLLEVSTPGLTGKLLECRSNGAEVISRWQWSYKGKVLGENQFILAVRNCSLAVKVCGGNGRVHIVRTGAVKGLRDFTLNTIPYWVMRPGKGGDPQVLSVGNMLLSVYFDIYSSRASDYLGSSGVQADGTAAINGGTVYNNKTDGNRNEVDELIFVNVSSRLNGVLPHLVNQPNPTMPVTRNGIWVTRMWYDVMPMYDYFERAYDMLKLYHRHGMRNLMVRDHQTLYRQYSPKRRGGFEGCVDSIHADLGGDAAAAVYFKRATEELGYRMGLYSNFTLIPPTLPQIFNYNVITLDQDGNPRYGSGETLMYKYHYMLSLQRKINDTLKNKFKLTCSYPDQYTCRAPWEFTDYDAQMPGAGQYLPAMRVLAQCSIVEREDFEVALSEGVTQWMFAGVIDSYSQPGSADDPVFPEFQLRKIHLLNNDCGAHLSLVFSTDPAGVDRAIAMQLANGNIGHLYGQVGDAPPEGVPFEKLKSYYISKELQKFYAGIAVENTAYHYQGSMLTAEEVLARGLIRHNQIYIKYVNGLEVWVNANAQETWNITLGSRQIELPPYGYYACLPGTIETGSIMENGRRVDFSCGRDYIYSNGNGMTRDCGLFAAKHAYTALLENNEIEFIPVPYLGNERVTLNLQHPMVQHCHELAALDIDGNELWTKVLSPEKKQLDLEISGSVFSYKLR